MLGIISAGCGIGSRFSAHYATADFSQLILFLIIAVVLLVASRVPAVASVVLLGVSLLALISLAVILGSWLKFGIHIGQSASDLDYVDKRLVFYMSALEYILLIASLIILTISAVPLACKGRLLFRR